MSEAASILPVLAIVGPLLVAVLVLLSPGPRIAGAVVVAGVLGAWAVALGLLLNADAGGLAVLGGWAPPLGIALRNDGAAAGFVMFAATVMAAVALYAFRTGAPAGDERGKRVFWTLFFLLWAGLATVFLSHDLFTLYVALEIASLAGVAMVALSGGAAALVAQMRYLLVATFGSLLYLMGVALIYAEFGVLDLAEIGARIAPTIPAQAGMAFITFGLLLKSAIWPLHVWLPPAHSSAPAPVSALLSALVVKASLYVLLRLWFDVAAPLGAPALWTVLGALGAGAVVWGSVQALMQDRLKLMIAYSTVAQLGYVLFVFPLAAPGGRLAGEVWGATLMHMVAHGVAKASMFLAAGAILAATGSDRRDDLAGASRRLPVPVFALALAGLSIMSLPPSGGFVAKWVLLRAAVASGEWWIVAAMIAGGLLAAGYVLRFVLPVFRPVPEATSDTPLATGAMGAAALALALASVMLGIASAPVLGLFASGDGHGGAP